MMTAVQPSVADTAYRLNARDMTIEATPAATATPRAMAPPIGSEMPPGPPSRTRSRPTGIPTNTSTNMPSAMRRLWVGVHLEQVANRDHKVNITPFALVDVPAGIQPTELLLEKLDDDKAKVRP